MGMPLAVRADIDTDVRIVERTDVDTRHCFTHCNVNTGEPVGYSLGPPEEGGEYQVRSRSAYGCNSALLTDAGKVTPEQASKFEFKPEACSVKVQLRFASGEGDGAELDSAPSGEFGTDITVGLWDPRGISVTDGLTSSGGGRGRRLSSASESGRGGAGGKNWTRHGTGRGGIREPQRRRLEEDVDGVFGPRGYRYKEFAQESAEGGVVGDEEEINSFTQSPRGTLVIAVGAGAVSDVRAHLASLQDLPSDAMASAAARPVAALSGLLLLFAVVFGIVRNEQSWLIATLLLLALPLAAATHALCGCARRAEVVVSVPRGFSFSRFEFSGDGQVACSNCDGTESGDYSTGTAPYTAEPVTPTAVDEAFTQTTSPKYFDPRYLLSRPLKFEAATATHVVIQSHGLDEIEHCHPTDNPPTGTIQHSGQNTNKETFDGETAFYEEQESGHTVGNKKITGCARNSYVKASAHFKPTSAAKVNFSPTAEAFTVEVGSSVVESSGMQPVRPIKLVPASQVSIGAVIALLAGTMHHSTGSRWVMVGLLFGASAVWAQQASSDVVVVLDMPMGLCFSEVDLGDFSQITCPDCDAWTCPTKPGSDPPGPANTQSGAALASDQTWMAHLKTQWSEFTVATKSPCAAGGFDATIFTRGLHADDLPDTRSGFVRLTMDHTVGCLPCEAGTWMRTQGGECTECTYPTRCAGNNECAHNFTGTACGVCSPNFYQEQEDDDHPDGFCEVCPEPTAVGFVLFVVGILCSVMVFVLMTIKGTAVVTGQQALEDLQDKAESIQAQVEEAVSMVKQTLTYMQALVLLFGAKQFETPEWMTQLKKKIQSYAFVNIAEILDMKLPADCIMQSKETTLDDIYWQKFGATQWLFWSVCFVCLLLALIFDRLHYEKTKPVLPNFLGTATSTPTAVAGTMYSTLYITLLSSAARTFDCTTDDDGVSRLDDYPDIECWTGKALKFQVLGLLCTILYICIWVRVAQKQISNFRKFSGGDGDLDAEDLRRMHASQNVKNLELVDKDGDGIIDKEEMLELDKIKATEASKGAAATGDTVQSVEHEVVLSETDMKVEAAEYAKKTVLVLTVVFLTSHPWKSWIILVLAYCGYFVVRAEAMELDDSNEHVGDMGGEDSDKNEAAKLSEILQLLGEFFLVVLSAYFINRPEEEQGWGFIVVMIPIGFFNGAAAVVTFIYVVWFWQGVFAYSKRLKNQAVQTLASTTATELPEDNAVNEKTNQFGENDKHQPSTDAAEAPVSTDEIVTREGSDAGLPGAPQP